VQSISSGTGSRSAVHEIVHFMNPKFITVFTKAHLHSVRSL